MSSGMFRWISCGVLLVTGAAGLLMGAGVLGGGTPRWVGAALALAGVAGFMLGVILRRTGTMIGGVPGLLSEAAFLIGGAALVGIAMLLVFVGFSVPDGGIAVGVPMVLVGVAAVVLGVVFRQRGGDAMVAVAILLMGVALALLGMAALLGWVYHSGAGDSAFTGALLLVSVAVLAAGIAVLLLGAAVLRDAAGVGVNCLRPWSTARPPVAGRTSELVLRSGWISPR